MQQGRRTASLKASYEVIKNADMTKDLLLSGAQGGGAAGATGAGTPDTSAPAPTKASRKKYVHLHATQPHCNVIQKYTCSQFYFRLLCIHMFYKSYYENLHSSYNETCDIRTLHMKDTL